MLITALAFVAFQTQATTVSLNYQVGRTDLAVAKLAEASGVSMKAVGPIATEVVFIKVDDQPLSAVMRSLAKVTCGEWMKRKDGSFELSRPNSLRDRELAKEQNRKLKILNAWRDSLVATLDEPYTPESLQAVMAEHAKLLAVPNDPKFSEEQQAKASKRLDQLLHFDPAYRALARALRDLDLGPVAALSPQASVALGTEPNPAQLPLPGTAREAIDNLVPEQAVWGPALAASPIPEGRTAEDRFQDDFQIKFWEKTGDDTGQFTSNVMPWQRSLPYKYKPDHLLLTASCYSEDAYRLVLQMFTDAGRIVFKFEESDVNTWEDTKADPEVASSHKPVPLSPMDQAYFHRLEGTGKNIAGDIEKLKRFFDDPVHNDPLWLGNQTWLAAYVARKQKSVVACLSDSVGARTDEDWLDQPKNVDMKIVDSGPITEIYPRNFAKHWAKRVAREAMMPCAREFRKTGQIDLLTLVRLLATSEDTANCFGCDFVQLIDPDFRSGSASFEVPFQSAFTPLLASLSNEQLQLLKDRQTIAYSALTSLQQDLASRVVYGVRVNVDEEGFPPKGLPGFDPTYELPQGLGLGAGLSADFGEEQLVVFHNGQSQNDEFYTFNLSELHPFYGWMGAPPRLPAAGVDAMTYEIRRLPVVVLKCKLTQGHAVIGKFSGSRLPTGEPKVLFGQLPSDVQKKLEPILKMFRDFDHEKREGSDKP